jgi:hypothetical protein
MKKTLLILITWTIVSTSLGIFQSCCNPDPINYRLKSISGHIERIVDIELLGNYQTEYYVTEPYEPSASGIAYDSIGINILNDIETFSINFKGELFNKSFACSPAENYEILADLLITSNQDYNSSFPSETDLKQLMSIRQSFNPYLVKGESIITFLTNAQIGLGGSFITFNSPPDESKIHDLTIKFILKDGREYLTILQGLKINK